MAETPLIRLRARDAEDMQVVAACLQDALVPLGDIAYLKREKRFVMVVNRFKWETSDRDAAAPAPEAGPEADARFTDDAAEPGFERVNAGVCFDKVQAVRFQGLDLGNKDHILNLLTIQVESDSITLVFSGDILIRLEVGAIACHLEDLSEPWPTRWQPSHEDAEGADDAREAEDAGQPG